MICEHCNQDTSEGYGCLPRTYDCGKQVYAPIKYGDEASTGALRPRCFKCGTCLRYPHHFGCSEELCPVCGKFIAACGCPIKVLWSAPKPDRVGVPAPSPRRKPRRRRTFSKFKSGSPARMMGVPSSVKKRFFSPDEAAANVRLNDPASLLLVYNTCGIGHKENVEYYVHALRSILEQKTESDEVIVSACLSTPSTKRRLIEEFQRHGVLFNFIEEKVPVNVTFNHSVIETVKRFGHFSGYMYLDSGIQIRPFTLNEIRIRMRENRYAMIAAEASTDTGYKWLFGQHELPGDPAHDFIMPIGKTVNLHAQVFTDDLLRAYGRLMPDIFASYCTESTFSFLCAAIQRQFVVCRNVIVDHVHDMDSGAAGFRDGTFGTWDHVFRSPRTMAEIVRDPEGIAAGFGYEEWRNVLMHDHSKYDVNLHVKGDALKNFILKTLFLPKELLDYEQLKHTYIDNRGDALVYADDLKIAAEEIERFIVNAEEGKNNG